MTSVEDTTTIIPTTNDNKNTDACERVIIIFEYKKELFKVLISTFSYTKYLSSQQSSPSFFDLLYYSLKPWVNSVIS